MSSISTKHIAGSQTCSQFFGLFASSHLFLLATMWARTPFVKSILGPCPHSLRSSTLRLFSSSTTKENFYTKPESNDIEPENVVSQQQHVEDTAPYTEFVEPTPIQSLNIQKKIETMEKPGSIFNKYYLGSFDKDLLRYGSFLLFFS